jgi:hypothetical protein
MPIQLRTDTSAAEHNLRKSWPFAPNPAHFADCTRFLRTTAARNSLRQVFSNALEGELKALRLGAGVVLQCLSAYAFGDSILRFSEFVQSIGKECMGLEVVGLQFFSLL